MIGRGGLAIAALLGGGVAHADVPLIPTLDRIGPTPQLDLELGYLHAASPLFRADIDASILAAPSYGFYTQLPFSLAPDGDPRTVAAGGLEVGAFYAARGFAAHGLVLVPHAGVVLPTASRADGFLLDAATAPVRGNDFVLVYPRALTLRVGGSLLYANGGLFVRLDAGIDYCLRSDGRSADLAPSYKVDVGVGYDVANTVAVALATTNLVFGSSDSAAQGERLDAIALTVAGSAPTARTHPFLAIIRPFQGDTFAVTAGLSIAL
jgi:hypothetical protein